MTNASPGIGARLKQLLSLQLLDDRYPAIHGLRTLGILSVLQFHVTYLLELAGLKFTPWATSTSYDVFFGMDMFFVLSGFLIGSILLHSVERLGTLDVKRFYLRRVLRTFPPYYVVLCVLSLAQHLSADQKANLPYEFFFLTNFRNLDARSVVMPWGWSLGLEEQFYLTVPIFFWLLYKLDKPRARVALLLVLFLSGLAVRFFVWRSRPFWLDTELRFALYFSTYGRFDTLVAGILIAVVHRRWGKEMTTLLARPLVRGLFFVGILVCLWLLMDPMLFGIYGVQPMHLFAWGTITSGMYFLLLMLLLHGPPSVVSRFLSRPIFGRLATLGYGVYLVHVPVLIHVVVPAAQWAAKKETPVWVIWPVCVLALFALSLAVSWVLHVLVEKPAFALRQKLTG